MKILILWASLADYTVACFRALSQKQNVKIMLIYQPASIIAPFNQFDLSFCHSSFVDNEEQKINYELAIRDFNPDTILMASWNFRHFMRIAKQYKKTGTLVISAFDNQWQNTLKQKLGVITSNWFLKPAIDNFLVPSDRQAHFAIKLGYPQPYTGFYCANSTNFENINYNPATRNFLFIGRLIEQKGVRNLIAAYQQYRKKVEQPWGLIVAGSGELRPLFENIPGVELKSFVQPEELSKLMNEASCFVLPSLHENWGLVIHEAALSKLPIICTINCGASTWFVRDGQNGYVINRTSEALLNAMYKIHETPLDKLHDFSDYSYQLAQLWTVERWANYIYKSLLNIVRTI